MARYPDIITASSRDGGTPYYTNSSHLPVGYTADIFEALDIQDDMQTLYTSGTVFHAFLGEKLPDWKAAANLVRKIAENYRLPYFTLSPTYSICKSHGYLVGEQYKCPECGGATEVYSRITGYYRPVQNFNDGKAQEFKQRCTYDVVNSKLKSEGRKPRQPQQTRTVAKSVDNAVYLFTTKTCPNCRLAKAVLGGAGIEYALVDAEENVALVKEMGVKQAPTLVIVENGAVTQYANASNIKAYTETLAK